MKKSEELLHQIRITCHQGLPITNIYYIIKDYWTDSLYMLRKFGLKSWFSFWLTKFFVTDEGGEYDLIAKIKSNDFVELGNIVLDTIRSVNGVIDTKTLTGTNF